MQARVQSLWGCWCAKQSFHLWDVPDEVRQWVETRDPALRSAAYDAAQKHISWGLVSDAGSARYNAAYASVHAAFVGEDNGAARKSSWALALHRDGTHEERVLIAEQHIDPEFRRALYSIVPIAKAIQEHGLAARLLDQVRKHPDLTLMIVKECKFPDLEVWEDWEVEMMRALPEERW